MKAQKAVCGFQQEGLNRRKFTSIILQSDFKDYWINIFIKFLCSKVGMFRGILKGLKNWSNRNGTKFSSAEVNIHTDQSQKKINYKNSSPGKAENKKIVHMLADHRKTARCQSNSAIKKSKAGARRDFSAGTGKCVCYVPCSSKTSSGTYVLLQTFLFKEHALSL